MPDWKDYQEEATEFFRSLGLSAETDVRVDGVRTKHDVDVLVKFHHYGFDVTWIVECKHWEKPVSKLHVLALREIVTDTGADRGILLCETGFQSGAIEAANLTNVQVTSLAELGVTAREQINAVRLRELYDRTEQGSQRYWSIEKQKRINDGLRPDVGQPGYSGARAIDVCRDLLSRAALALYPFRCEINTYDPNVTQDFTSATQVVQAVEELLDDLEHKLAASEASISKS